MEVELSSGRDTAGLRPRWGAMEGLPQPRPGPPPPGAGLTIPGGGGHHAPPSSSISPEFDEPMGAGSGDELDDEEGSEWEE